VKHYYYVVILYSTSVEGGNTNDQGGGTGEGGDTGENGGDTGEMAMFKTIMRRTPSMRITTTTTGTTFEPAPC
jgi:hypothetical protein